MHQRDIIPSSRYIDFLLSLTVDPRKKYSCFGEEGELLSKAFFLSLPIIINLCRKMKISSHQPRNGNLTFNGSSEKKKASWENMQARFSFHITLVFILEMQFISTIFLRCCFFFFFSRNFSLHLSIPFRYDSTRHTNIMIIMDIKLTHPRRASATMEGGCWWRFGGWLWRFGEGGT